MAMHYDLDNSHRNPEERLPGPEVIKEHPFFKGIDWANLYNMSMEDIFVPQPVSHEDTFYFCKKIYVYFLPFFVAGGSSPPSINSVSFLHRDENPKVSKKSTQYGPDFSQ
jgi:hypothetical protein